MPVHKKTIKRIKRAGKTASRIARAGVKRLRQTVFGKRLNKRRLRMRLRARAKMRRSKK